MNQAQIVLGYCNPREPWVGVKLSCEIMLLQPWPNPWRIPSGCCLYRVAQRNGDHADSLSLFQLTHGVSWKKNFKNGGDLFVCSV